MNEENIIKISSVLSNMRRDLRTNSEQKVPAPAPQHWSCLWYWPNLTTPSLYTIEEANFGHISQKNAN